MKSIERHKFKISKYLNSMYGMIYLLQSYCTALVPLFKSCVVWLYGDPGLEPGAHPLDQVLLQALTEGGRWHIVPSPATLLALHNKERTLKLLVPIHGPNIYKDTKPEMSAFL